MAQFRYQLYGCLFEFRGFTKVNDEGAYSLFCRRRDALFLEFRDDAFYTGAKADTGRRLSTEQFCQAIVASTTIQGQFVNPGGELEDRARVVVKPTHDKRINFERHVVELQKTLHRCKVFAARLAQVVRNLWGSLNLLLILLVFAIQQAQRILVEAHLAVLAAIAQQRAIVILQYLDVLRSTVAISNTVDIDADMFQPKRSIELIEQADDFSVNSRVVIP